ncbi:AAA family ATPase [Candidatus Pacearchaeota archaeon]|nr:AAA family ATPase [Candidatus Pacearchaeota archaeon]
MKKKVLIGLIGTIGSGKTTASNYLVKKFKFKRVIMGNLVRAITRKEGLQVNRKNLLLTQKKYRTKYGNDYFIKTAVKKVEGAKRGLIDGVRVPMDAIIPKKAGAKIILIDASPKLRFERMKKRGRKGFSKTFTEFKKEEAMEFKLLDLKKTFKYVDYKIINNGNEKEFFKKFNKLIKKLI